MTDQQRRLPAPDSTPDAPALNVYGQTKEGAGVHLAGNYAGLRALEEHIHKALAHDYPVFTGPERFVNLNNGRPYLLSIESDRKGPGHPSWLNNPDPYDVPHAYDNQEGHEYKRLYKRMKYAERHAEGRDSRAREMERENVRLKLALLFTDFEARKPPALAERLAGAHRTFRKIHGIIATCRFAIGTERILHRSSARTCPARSVVRGTCTTTCSP